ncbi:MAG: hypothetical protein Q9224_001745 [Gallowayella concinna]
MSASRPDTGRGRTKTAKQELDSDSDESDTTASQAGRTFSNAVPGTFKYRSRVNEYNNNVEFPLPPLYAVNELVYLEMPGQAQPAGPYQVSACVGNKQYKIKRVDNGQEHPTIVNEDRLVVPGP